MTVSELWTRLCGMRSTEWLSRLGAMYPQAAQRRLSSKTFVVYLSVLRLLHEQVFGPPSDGDCIPNDSVMTVMPSSGGDSESDGGDAVPRSKHRTP